MKHLAHMIRGIDITKAVMQLEAHPELWNQNRVRTASYASPHNKLSDIWLRYNDLKNFDETEPALFNEEHDSVFYPAWHVLTELHEHVFNIMRFTRSVRLGGLLITKIPPGATCEPHIDRGWHATYYSKYALQLKAAPGQAFHFEDGAFVSEPGDVFTFDNSYTHWVTNESNVDRITLIICARS